MPLGGGASEPQLRRLAILPGDRLLLISTGALREMDDHAIDAMVFPGDGIRQAPVSPVDGRPMRRADLAQVEELLGQG